MVELLRGGQVCQGLCGDGAASAGAPLVEEEDAVLLQGPLDPPGGDRHARGGEARAPLQVEEVGQATALLCRLWLLLLVGVVLRDGDELQAQEGEGQGKLDARSKGRKVLLQ